MSAEIIDGKFVANQLQNKFKTKIASLAKKGIKPGLAVILIGEDPASKIYVQNKITSCEQLGINSYLHKLQSSCDQNELTNLINFLNFEQKVHGILVQLPLPKHLNEQKILATIVPQKDVDGFSASHLGAILIGKPSIISCTPAGVLELLNFYKITVEKKHAVIVGRSNIVGKPLAMLLLAAGATVTICHSKTKDLTHHTKQADLLIMAIGKPRFLKASMIKSGAVIIDIGINRDHQNKICGDVDFQSVAEKASWITPVPGGVGPMTIAMLLNNTINSALKEAKTDE